MAKPTDRDRREYPLLTARDDWPPPRLPDLRMDRPMRLELRRYWDDRTARRGRDERANPPQWQDDGRPWYEQAADNMEATGKTRERSVTPEGERSPALRLEREAQRSSGPNRSPAPEREESMLEASGRAHREHEAELRRRARQFWFYTKRERQLIRDMKELTIETPRHFFEREMEKRVDREREKDRQAYLKRAMAPPKPSVRERMEKVLRRKRDPDRER